MKIPPSIYNAYNICPKQAWMMIRQLNADQDNQFLEIGRVIDDDSFKRDKKKIFIADLSAEIDMVTRKNGDLFIAEIKKSSKRLDDAINQLKYYLYLLKKRKGLKIKGLVKIPKEKISKEFNLEADDEKRIEKVLKEMDKVLNSEKPPKAVKTKLCSRCAHFDFCWS